jgi:hypothetical protein
MFLGALALATVFFSLTVEARADGGSIDPAPCETKRPAGPAINGTVGIELNSAFGADVTLSWQFHRMSQVTRARLADGGVDTQSVLHAICSILVAPTADASPTLEEQILNAIGRPTGKIRVTKRALPDGLDLDFIPGTDIRSAVADVRLHVQR